MTTKNNELPVIQLPAELKKVASDTHMSDLTLAEKIAANYVPFIEQIEAQVTIFKTLKKGVAADCDKAKRVSLDLGKICQRIKEQKETDKAYYLVVSRYIDGLFNAIEGKGRLTQAEAKEIADHWELQEKARVAKLAMDRTALLLPFCEHAATMKLGDLGEQEFNGLLEAYEIKFKEAEKTRIAAEAKAAKEEKERLEREAKLKEENEKLKKEVEAKNALRTARGKELFQYNTAFHDKDVAEIEDKEWKEILKVAKQRFDEAEKKKEADKKDKEANEAKIKALEDAENKRLAAEKKKTEEEAAKKKADELAAKALLKAPDKEQLKEWLKTFTHDQAPKLKSVEATNAENEILNKWSGFNKWATELINKL